MRYDLEPVEPPALPSAPTEYIPGEREKYSNVLRLYFNRISSFIRNLIGTAGGRFLDFPNGAFADNRDYVLSSTAVAAPLRFNSTVYSNGVQVISEVITEDDFGGPLFGYVDNGGGLSGNLLTVTTFLSSVVIDAGMVVTMTGLPAGTYITGQNSSTVFTLSNSALLTSRAFSLTAQSKVQVLYAGRYNFQFSIQFVNFDNAPHTLSVWWRKNGTDIADSNSEFGIPIRKNAGDPSHVIASMNFFVDLEKDDYIQVIWRTQDTDVNIEHFNAVAAGAGTPAIPATPSVILTANFISRLANT
jgi:hypothetical protein